MGFRLLLVGNYEGGNHMESCDLKCGRVWLKTHTVNWGSRRMCEVCVWVCVSYIPTQLSSVGFSFLYSPMCFLWMKLNISKHRIHAMLKSFPNNKASSIFKINIRAGLIMLASSHLKPPTTWLANSVIDKFWVTVYLYLSKFSRVTDSKWQSWNLISLLNLGCSLRHGIITGPCKDNDYLTNALYLQFPSDRQQF